MDIQIEIMLAAVLGLVGFRQIDLGLWSRRVGSEPHCRKCEYDLRGLPSDTSRCSECGADLTSKHARVKGVPQHRPALVWRGLVLLLIASVPAVHVIQRIAANGWQKVKPVWVLRWELGLGNPDTRKAADQELWRRMSSNELAESDLVRIAKWGATSNLSAKELPHIVADAAAVARGAGRLSDEEFVKLWKTGFSPTVRTKEKVRQGNDLYVHVAMQNELSGHAVASRVKFICRQLTVDGQPANDLRGTNFDSVIANPVGRPRLLSFNSFDAHYPALLRIPANELKSSALGKHSLRFSVRYELTVGSPLPPTSDYSSELVVERQFELVSPDQPTVRLLTDPPHEERASKGMAVSFGANGNFFEATPSVPVEPPIAMAYRVYFQNANLRIAVGSWTSGIFEQSIMIPGLRVKDRPTQFADEVEIIFEPDPELAEQGPLVNEIWGKPRIHRFGLNPAR